MQAGIIHIIAPSLKAIKAFLPFDNPAVLDVDVKPINEDGFQLVVYQVHSTMARECTKCKNLIHPGPHRWYLILLNVPHPGPTLAVCGSCLEDFAAAQEKAKALSTTHLPILLATVFRNILE